MKRLTLSLNRFDSPISNYWYLDISIGSGNTTHLKALVDFDSNSPLVVFEIGKDVYNSTSGHKRLRIEPKYISSQSSSFTDTNFDRNCSGHFELFDYNGTYANDRVAFLTSEGEEVEMNVNFIIPESIVENEGIDFAPEFNAVVGFGFLSAFSTELFTNNLIGKNVMILPSLVNADGPIRVTFGDYESHMKEEGFAKLTTLNVYIGNDDRALHTNLTGITYLINKGIMVGQDVVLSASRMTDICFDPKWMKFFNEVFPGNMGNGCYPREQKKGVTEFYCKDRDKVNNGKSLRFVFGAYTYQPSVIGFLFMESEDNVLKFVVKTCEEQKSVFGKEFFGEFVFVFNNENQTINVFSNNRTTKLNVELDEFSEEWKAEDDDVGLTTPGSFAVAIVGLVTVVVCFIYILKCCYHRDNIDDYTLEREKFSNIY